MVQWLVFLLASYLAGNIIGRTCSKQQLMKSAMAVLALMLVYRCGYVRCATVPQDSTDMLALIDFRQAITGDPKGFFYSWNNSVNYCNWNGVTCVRELNLTGQSLEGRIVRPKLGRQDLSISWELNHT